MSADCQECGGLTAAVRLQGGTLVLEHRMSQGSLISFMLYQGSLSSAFDSLGYCFTGMSAAVGVHRTPSPPSRCHRHRCRHCVLVQGSNSLPLLVRVAA